MGSHYPNWVTKGRHSRAFGLLCGLDAVANFHCAEAHALMALLRRQGTKTIASLHVTDLSRLDRPNGHTYLTLGYEHAYDLFACCSQQLVGWCHAMGIPEGKLSLLWNAPSYALPAAAVEEVVAAREMREPGPLRVLFLGRLDRQKGLDRLVAIVRRFVARINSRAQSAPRSDTYVRRTYSGRPSSSMRFSEAAAMATSVVCRPPVRERSASPITRL
jgi:glycosyltransferase involved in cell wall biosynthesis